MNCSIPFTANTTCPKMCKFTMSNLNYNGARDLKIKLLFNNVNNNRVVDACANRSPKQGFRELYINCSSWNEGKVLHYTKPYCHIHEHVYMCL